jgi:hypothetical protein
MLNNSEPWLRRAKEDVLRPPRDLCLMILTISKTFYFNHPKEIVWHFYATLPGHSGPTLPDFSRPAVEQSKGHLDPLNCSATRGHSKYHEMGMQDVDCPPQTGIGFTSRDVHMYDIWKECKISPTMSVKVKRAHTQWTFGMLKRQEWQKSLR